MSRYLISAALLIGLGTLKTAVVGDILGPSDFPSDQLEYSSELVNESPITDTKSVEVVVTAYSSREQETDDTPYTTAAGTTVRTGVVAANWLPLGTKVRIPEIFGDEVFTVEDRMHKRNKNKLDVWFPNTEDALRFGVRRTRVEIL
jgi:3D (Asp-Asp-Asp) domain-containing protein